MLNADVRKGGIGGWSNADTCGQGARGRGCHNGDGVKVNKDIPKLTFSSTNALFIFVKESYEALPWEAELTTVEQRVGFCE